MEALCAPSSIHSTATIVTCLQAFAQLCTSQWSQVSPERGTD